MWIVPKIYKDLLEYIESRSLPTFTSSSMSERLEGQIIKTMCVQVSRLPKQDTHDRPRETDAWWIYISVLIYYIN